MYVENVYKIFKILAETLNMMHSKNIVHRDIKLENIMIDDDLNPVYIDFGFSCYVKHNNKQYVCPDKDIGTPSYYKYIYSMRDYPYTKTVEKLKDFDVFALGVYLFIMLYFYSPFHEKMETEPFFNKTDTTIKFYEINENYPIYNNIANKDKYECLQNIINTTLALDSGTIDNVCDIINKFDGKVHQKKFIISEEMYGKYLVKNIQKYI
jgi:serine/threonine protein kinase